jgi:hypothetical protein
MAMSLFPLAFHLKMCTIVQTFGQNKEKHMGLIASSNGSGGDFEVVPTGTHRAICYKLADAGTREEKFKDEDAKKRHTIFIFFELPDLRTAKDKPFSIFKQYTLSLNENSALHKDLKSWRGKSFSEAELRSFDMANILGVNCDIEVEHTAGGRAKIVSIFKPDGGAKKVVTENDQILFDLEIYCKEFSGESCAESKLACDVFADLPAFLCEMIEGSYELAAAYAKGRKAELVESKGGLAAMSSVKKAPVVVDDFLNDDIPF